jgi:hypothetical protein
MTQGATGRRDGGGVWRCSFGSLESGFRGCRTGVNTASIRMTKSHAGPDRWRILGGSQDAAPSGPVGVDGRRLSMWRAEEVPDSGPGKEHALRERRWHCLRRKGRWVCARRRGACGRLRFEEGRRPSAMGVIAPVHVHSGYSGLSSSPIVAEHIESWAVPCVG